MKPSLFLIFCSLTLVGVGDLLAEPVCKTLPTFQASDWRHTRSKLMTKVSKPRHFARDVIVVKGEAGKLDAKFTYGSASKDLEDEGVVAYLSTCDKVKRVGVAKTDSDGWARFHVVAPSKPGFYDVTFRVQGDGTEVSSQLVVLPKTAKFVVFDIDGTLTTSDDEVIKDVGNDYFKSVGEGSYEPVAYPFGKELVDHYVSRGYTPLYLSGRPYWLMAHTRDWLAKNKFADGPLVITRRNRDSRPTQKGVGAFKLRELTAIKKTFAIEYAHGNAETDIYAYLGAGIPKANVFIIGPHAGKSGTVAVKDSWEPVLVAAKRRANKKKK